MKVMTVLKNRFVSHSPVMLTHLITSLCNARCKTCDLWKKSSEYRTDLSKEDVFKLLEKAKKAGMVSYTVWGGEPLLRKDLPEILQFAKKKGFITTVITNGFFLKERCEEITPFTDLMIVSIDSNDSLHDKMRGVEGILKRAIDGIEKCKKTKTKVIMNSVISKLNLDKIEGLLELSKKLNVPIAFEPMDINPGYNEHLKTTNKELKTAFSRIIRYKKSGYKVINSIQYLQNFSKQKKYVCHAPKCYIAVSAHGKIESCVGTNSKCWGNIKETSFEEIFNSLDFKDFCKKMEMCNKCNVSCVIESSLMYSLNPWVIIDKIKNLY